jgi:gamma-glutamylputrescine oxidase
MSADHPASYYAATAEGLVAYPALTGAQSCDVAVVGGGYTGLSAALHLAERGFKVIVLEARRVGWGASGRNGGQLHSGQRRDQATLEAMVGKDDARRLWRIGEEAKALIVDLIRRHDIACELKFGLLHADHKRRYAARSRAHVDKLRNDYAYDKAAFVDRDEIRAMVASENYHGGWLDSGGGHLHPLNLALGIGRAAAAAGATLCENSRVTGIVEGDPVRVETDSGAVSARFLLLACNGYFEGLAPRVERRVMPINNFMVAKSRWAKRRRGGSSATMWRSRIPASSSIIFACPPTAGFCLAAARPIRHAFPMTLPGSSAGAC